MKHRERIVHAACVTALSVAVVFLYGDLFDNRAFNSHEIYYEYMRAFQVAKELVSGHFPQVFPDAIYGAGFAFPRFYPPFSLWLSALLGLAVGDTVLGVNLTFFLSALASAVTMYVAAWILVRDARLALAAALVYVSMPYRFVDVYARGALAESWTFAWYPLIVAGLGRAAARRSVPWYLPASVAGLVLTHNITALYFLVFCALFTALTWYWEDWRAALGPALGIALGLGLAAWFVLPQQVYLKSVWVSDARYMWADDAHVNAHRVLPLEFFYSVPRRWFGESHDVGYDDGMSFELGAFQLLIVPMFLLLLRSWQLGRCRRGGRLVMLMWLTFAGWVTAIAFMMIPGAFLALLPPQFAYLQFPWRLLAFAAFSSALGIALFAKAARASSAVRTALAAAGVAAVLLVPAFERTKWTKPDWTDETLLTRENVDESGWRGYTVLGEYLPRDFDVASFMDGAPDVARFTTPRVIDGEGSVEAWSRSDLDLDVDVASSGGCMVALPLVAYDFYRAEDESGRKLETSSAEGFLAVRVPPGSTEVRIRRGVTRVVLAGFAVGSAAAVVTVVACVALRRRTRRSRRTPASEP